MQSDQNIPCSLNEPDGRPSFMLRLRAIGMPLLVLLLASAAGVLLVGLRIAWTGNLRYLFLIWNLFLAWLPLVFSIFICRECRAVNRKRWRLALLGVLWLVFLPNAPYILTDLIHLSTKFRNHFWVDLSLMLLFAFTGLMLGFVSLYLMQQVVARRLGGLAGWLFVTLIAPVSSFGVYVGRFRRWNSWDIVVHPIDLSRDLGHIATHPLANYLGFVFPILFGTFLFLAYLMLYALTHLQSMGARDLNQGT
jgi:uncharacterized membrane protein